ncbi:MAG: HEAT repeat domain-containing protein [Nostocaceae cyanobacterium]|nr:HEAT repeat domain-containing protein [Nostocaceae cyanobacterium]
MAVIPRPDFQAYLQAIAQNQKYQCWENSYTSTDTVAKQQEFFHMGLMVQTLQPKQREGKLGEEKLEKIERLAVLDGIRKYAEKHVLLVGKPGSGKSTALERLLWEEAQKTQTGGDTETRGKNSPTQSVRASPCPPSIPVLVRLREYQTSVLEIIENFFTSHDLYLSETEIDNLLSTRQLLLLMDGLNELPDDKARREVTAFRKKYCRTPMIFTTRDVSLGGDCGIEKKLEMQPLTEKQMREFVQAYLKNYSEQFLRQLSDRLRKFSETPLLLWMLCRVYAQEGKIPANLGEAFRDFTQLYDNQLKSDVPGYENYRQWCGDLLQALAFQMMQGTTATELRLQIPQREAEDILTQFLEREKFDKPRDYAKRWLEDLLEHHLIATVGQQKIEFQHQLVQEYYAAEYLLRLVPSLSDRTLQRDYLNYLKWTETIALVLGLMEDEPQALRVVRLALDVDLMLGARLAGEVKREFQEKTKNFIEELQIPLEHKAWLSNFSSQTVADTRQEFEKDFEEHMIENGAYLPHFLGYEDAIPVVEYGPRQNKNENIYQPGSIIYEYQKTQDKQLLFSLLQDLKNQDFMIRFNAAHILGEIHSEATVDELIEAYNAEFYGFIFNWIVRMAIILALEEIGSEKAIPTLRFALMNEENFLMRNGAVNALFKIGSDAVVPILIEALNDEKCYVRENVVEVLGKVGNELAISALKSSLYDPEYGVFWRGAEALNKIQERCKFYNHKIYHSPPVEEEASTDLLNNNQVINVYPQTLTMQEPTNNLNFNAPVGAVNTGNVQVKGTLNQVGTQHNYPSEQKQSLAEAAKEIQDLLTQLSLNYPTITPVEQQQLVAQVDEQVKTNSRLRYIILAGGIELIKILCPPLGIPIEMGRKWLETAEGSQ